MLLPEISDKDRNWYILKGYEIDEHVDYRMWLLNGKLHREDGPAYEGVDGYHAWWVNSRRHREDGPAIEYADGDRAWYLNGIEMSEEEHEKISRTRS